MNSKLVAAILVGTGIALNTLALPAEARHNSNQDQLNQLAMQMYMQNLANQQAQAAQQQCAAQNWAAQQQYQQQLAAQQYQQQLAAQQYQGQCHGQQYQYGGGRRFNNHPIMGYLRQRFGMY